MKIIIAVVTLITALTSPVSLASQVYRFHVGIDSVRHSETINITTFPTSKKWRSKVTVSIGTAKYSTDYFSAQFDLPSIKILSIDSIPSKRQLLLETPEAGSCVYHLLNYVERKLVPLLKFDSGSNCKAPVPLGNGQFSVSTWNGFWTKEDRYKLSDDGKTLSKEQKTIYKVETAGVANKVFLLQGSECTTRTVQPGTYVKIKLYDSESDRYSVETWDGSCGWISAGELDSLNSIIGELPWAS